MNDALLMGRFERFRDLLRDRECFVEGDRAARNPLREVLALDEFHHERGDASTLLEAVDGGDVRIVQGREHFRFALKTREPIVVRCQCRRQDLDRDLALQFRVGRPKHLAHSPFTDLGRDVVDAEARSGSYRQCCRELYGANRSYAWKTSF
jgi:hypothetical protein